MTNHCCVSLVLIRFAFQDFFMIWPFFEVLLVYSYRICCDDPQTWLSCGVCACQVWESVVSDELADAVCMNSKIVQVWQVFQDNHYDKDSILFKTKVLSHRPWWFSRYNIEVWVFFRQVCVPCAALVPVLSEETRDRVFFPRPIHRSVTRMDSKNNRKQKRRSSTWRSHVIYILSLMRVAWKYVEKTQVYVFGTSWYKVRSHHRMSS